jgi:hypothetical protein
MKQNLKKYTVVTYDLWGNNKEGYEVNGVYFSGSITIDPDWDDKKILKAVRKMFDIPRGTVISGHGDRECIYLELEKNLKPVLELRATND